MPFITSFSPFFNIFFILLITPLCFRDATLRRFCRCCRHADISSISFRCSYIISLAPIFCLFAVAIALLLLHFYATFACRFRCHFHIMLFLRYFLLLFFRHTHGLLMRFFTTRYDAADMPIAADYADISLLFAAIAADAALISR